MIGAYTKAAKLSQPITHFFSIESKDEENTVSELNNSEGENDSEHEGSDFEVENANSLEPKLTDLKNIQWV
ncbi:8717_t:CDS:2 [Entrophospora sp. SA101]|nr:8717_t:CDS:2 [Entrophospora sp. SA101]CAJ0840373.1 9287_t:CDS:2 [Entrophospora sp. SA101]